MQLPPELQEGIKEITAEVSPGELSRSASELSLSYRERQRSRPQLDASHRAAYVATRLPATYAVLSRVLREAKRRIPELRVETMFDLGAGPGTAMWSASTQFPELTHATLVEDSVGWIDVGQRLAARSANSAVRSAEWLHTSVLDPLPPEIADLVVMSYVLNELEPADQLRAAQTAWRCSGKLLVIVEPGTPAGFEHIREIRHGLLASGAHLIAPCPRESECPMIDNDWCHFSERVQRTSEHRMAKGAELGYEDEKYSYVIAAHQQIALPAARILRHPQKRSGHIEFELCTSEGLKRETISRRQGDWYKAAKKAKWGETLGE